MPVLQDASHGLEFRGVDAGYSADKMVIRDASFSVPRVGLWRLCGPNGSGKSTLVELAAGYLRPRRGQVFVSGDVAHSRPALLQRTVCRSDVSFFPEMSMLEHFEYFARLRRAKLESFVERATRYNLDDWFDEPAKKLSTGTARKAWIVLTTTVEASVRILDEPFQGLDSTAIEQLSSELRDWAEGSLVIVVAHDWPASLGEHQQIEFTP